MLNFLKKIMLYKITEKQVNYGRLDPKRWNWALLKRVGSVLAFIIILYGAFIVVKDELSYQFGWGYYAYDEEYGDEYAEEGTELLDCNVYGLSLRGYLDTHLAPENTDIEGEALEDTTISSDLVADIYRAESEESIKAILLEINSFGGNAVAAEEVEKALQQAKKPVVAYIRTAGTSAAYWAASGADYIFASKLSDVGGIGVTFSYLDRSRQNENEGLTYNSLSTGKYKDYGDADKPLTADEKALIMRDLNIVHDEFVRVVASNRELPIEQVRALADGSSLPGELSLEAGLIDAIGGLPEAQAYLEGLIAEPVTVCW